MRYLPVNLDLAGRRCVVVGGGEVAARKVAMLRRVGARIEVISPALVPALAGAVGDGGIEWKAREFDDADLDGAALAIAATDDSSVNARVATACAARGLFVNVVDTPALCTFTMPAIIDRAPLVVSVASEGAAPMLATAVRKRIEVLLPRHYAELGRFMGQAREKVKLALPDPAARRSFWRAFLASDLPARLVLEPAEVETAFDALLASGVEPSPRSARIRLDRNEATRLTLGDVDLLAAAERIVHGPELAPGILDYARRDAELVCTRAPDSVPPAPAGLTVYLEIEAPSEGGHQPRVRGAGLERG